MQTTLEETAKHTVRLTVEVEIERVGKDLDRAYRKVANQVRIPGFRKGKVPRRVIDAQIGREAVVGEFLEDAVPVYYREALREHELAPITDPDISLEQIEEGKPLVFTATVEVRPRLELVDYHGIRVERPSAEVSDAEVEDVLQRLRDRFAELEAVAHPARAGDYVVADFRASVHGEEVPEATFPDYLYQVGSGDLLGDRLDKELEGKRAGEILKFNATLPDRFGERAGREVSVQVLVKEIKGKRLPEADDEFAKTASEFDTIEEFRQDIRRQIAQTKEREADIELRDRVLESLVNRVDVDLPDSLVDEETRQRMERATERARRAGVSLEDALAAQDLDELEFRSDARAHAIRAIKADLVLEAVARQEGLEVSADELGAEIRSLAAALDRDPKDVARQLERSGQVVALAGDIIRSKALDFLVEHADATSEGESLGSEEDSAEAESESDSEGSDPSSPPAPDEAEAEES